MFERLLPSYEEKISLQPGAGETALETTLSPSDFDWALHPGGQAILNGAQQALHLKDDQLQASRDIYRTRGNSSSATVLAVLDLLRTMGKREHIVATSFGPGMTIEMAILRKCEAIS
jgi:type III polyketide synthase